MSINVFPHRDRKSIDELKKKGRLLKSKRKYYCSDCCFFDGKPRVHAYSLNGNFYCGKCGRIIELSGKNPLWKLHLMEEYKEEEMLHHDCNQKS